MIDKRTRQHFEQSVVPRLRALGLRLRAYLLLDGLAMMSLVVLAAILITLGVDYVLHLGWDMRLVQLLTLLTVIAGVLWQNVYRPLRKPIQPCQLAILVERQFPQLQSRLISAVEFMDPVESERMSAYAYSPVLADATVRQAQAAVADLCLGDVLAHARARMRAMLIVACLGIVVLLTLLLAETMGLWFQRNVLLQNVNWPLRNQLVVEGLVEEKIIVPRGEDAIVFAVVAKGYEAPRQTYIVYKNAAGRRSRQQMPAVIGEQVRFSHTFERVTESLRCQIVGGDAQTEVFAIEVVDRPRISRVTMHVTPPAYTQMEGYDLRAGQTVIDVLQGSEIRLSVKTNKPVCESTLLCQTTDTTGEATKVERLSESEFIATDTPLTSTTYYFCLVDDFGLDNLSGRASPVRLSVRLVADKPPRVKMRIEDVGGMIVVDAILRIAVDFADTYGLATAGLVTEVTRDGTKLAPVTESRQGFIPGTKSFARTFDWPVSTHKLAEGDHLKLYARASDFDDIAGPNVGTSTPVSFRVVSREALLSELNRREHGYRQDFERILRRQEELYAQLLSAVDRSQQQDETLVRTNTRKQRLAQLARRQRDLAGQMNMLRLQFEQVLAELRANQLSDATVEERLARRIAQPMGALAKTKMPDAADVLTRLAQDINAETQQQAQVGQEAVLQEMNQILANLIQWEGFQEALQLLREVLEMQEDVSEETEKRIEAEIFGTKPATEK